MIIVDATLHPFAAFTAHVKASADGAAIAELVVLCLECGRVLDATPMGPPQVYTRMAQSLQAYMRRRSRGEALS